MAKYEYSKRVCKGNINKCRECNLKSNPSAALDDGTWNRM